jgi:hypothetical protein
MNLTMRSKITIRWTTNPADMGYDGNPSNWLQSPGETMGIRAAARFQSDLNRYIGQGVLRLIEYKNNGRILSLDDIRAVISDAEYYKRCKR